MSATTIERPVLEEPAADLEPAPTYAKRPSHRPRVGPTAASVFLISFVGYLVLGWQVTLVRHVVPGDGLSRLAHAYFVFYNAPAKLVAIGFVWPPLMTAVFLPLAVVKPIATSYWALPIMSALFGAGLLVTIERSLRASGMRLWQRLTLVAAFGVNPMIACYASNGMSEIVAVYFLTTAVAAFLRWHAEHLPRQLIVVGISLALGTLVRYEIGLTAFVLVPGILLMIRRGPRKASEVEASIISLLAPVLYGIGIWTFLNWSILGSPLAWLHAETTQTFAGTQTASDRQSHISLVSSLRNVLDVNLHLFPLVFVAVAGLVVCAVVRREWFSPTLIAVLLLNIVTSAALAFRGQTSHLFDLRFNMRAMPLVVVVAGWLFQTARSEAAKNAVWVIACVALLAVLPLTWRTLQTYPHQLEEQGFTRALVTGHDQEGTYMTGLHSRSRIVPDVRMGNWIHQHVHSRDAVLTDDAQAYGIMLSSGHPELFFDRVDHGDARWFQVAHAPFGHVRYLLFTYQSADVLSSVFPHAYGQGGKGLRLAHATSTSRLYEVVGSTA